MAALNLKAHNRERLALLERQIGETDRLGQPTVARRLAAFEASFGGPTLLDHSRARPATLPDVS